METTACLLVVGAMAVGAEGKSEAEHLLAAVDQQLVARYMTLMQETVDWIRASEKPDGWAYQYLPDGTPCFSLGGVVYRHDQPEKWPKEFPQKHSGIQKFTHDNGGPGDAPQFLAAWRDEGTLKAKFTGPVKLSPEEYERAELSAAKWVASQKGQPGSPAQFLMKLRTAQGRFTAEQLPTGAPPHFGGQGLHSFKVANWFDIPWHPAQASRPNQDTSQPVLHFRPPSQ